MRLFVALDIDDNIRGRLSRFVEEVRGFSPGGALGPARILTRHTEIQWRENRTRGEAN